MSIRRAFWVLFGAVNQLLFGGTVLGLFIFLKGGEALPAWFPTAGPPGERWIWVDSLLAIQFAVLHSAMLWPPIRSWLNRRMPPAMGGSVFCATSCVSLLATMALWRASPRTAWHATGAAELALTGLFLASWGALTYSLWLTGFGYQTGFTTWWAWARGRGLSPRTFSPKGAYRVLRHPVYLSFLGLVWFNPTMTIDRLTLALLWTTHILVGSYLKDRRLERFIGEPYRRYAAAVPGYPLMQGPLGRRPVPRSEPMGERRREFGGKWTAHQRQSSESAGPLTIVGRPECQDVSAPALAVRGAVE